MQYDGIRKVSSRTPARTPPSFLEKTAKGGVLEETLPWYQIMINSVYSADYIDDIDFARINSLDRKRKSTITVDLGGEDNYILYDEYINSLQAKEYGNIDYFSWSIR